MRWPWTKRVEEARAAAEEARRGLERAKARRFLVEREAAKIRYHRETNHLSQLFDQIIQGGHGS